MVDVFTPEDCLVRFAELHGALLAEARAFAVSGDALPFAAAALLAVPGEPPVLARELATVAGQLKKDAGWTGAMSSSTRVLIAAHLLRTGQTAASFALLSREGARLFREHDLRRGETHELMAILVLRAQSPSGTVEAAQVGRLKAMYEEMKVHHWWLTGPEDLALLALLCGQPGSPAEIAAAAEGYYQALKRGGLSGGEELQSVSHLLCLNPAGEAAVVARFLALRERFTGITSAKSDYDELAILTWLDLPAAQVGDRLLAHQQRIAACKPAPHRSLTFTLACSTAFVELAPLDPALRQVEEVRAFEGLHDLLSAQAAVNTMVMTSVLTTTTMLSR